MAQTVPSVARFELRYSVPNDKAENVYYARFSGGVWDEATMDIVVAEFIAWESAIASPMRGAVVGLYEIVATDLSSLSGIRKAYAVSPAIQGTHAGTTLPNNVTIALKADIGRRGRGTAGRSFWIGLTVLQVEDGQVGAVPAADLVAGMNTLRDAIAAVVDVEGLCVPHFVVGGVRPNIVGADVVKQYLMSDFFLDSQRDRLPFHKKHKRPPAV